MSLADRLRDMFSSGAGSGAAGASAAAKRRARNQAQPLTPGVRSYEATEPARPMARAQWIGLGLAGALAVGLTAVLVFVIMQFVGTGSRATPTPTALPAAVVSPTPNNSSIAAIFATFTPTPLTGSPTPSQPAIGQRLQVTGTGSDGVNLRRDPGQNGERIKTVREGTVLEIVGADQNVEGTVWRNVRDTQGESGWIAAGFLAAEGSVPQVGTAPGGVPGSSTGSDQPVTSATIVSGPSSAATAAPKPTSPGVAAAGSSRGQVGNTSGQGANIRSEPGSGGRVLKTVAEGTNLDVLGPEREVDGQIWRQVRDSSGVTGWIIRGAVAPPGTIPTPVPPAAGATRAPAAPGATSAPSNPQTGPTSAPAAKPTAGAGTAPAAPAATPRPTAVPGNLPIIIQPATPRPAGGGAAAATPTPKP